MARKKPIIESPYVTPFGTINVGDKVVAVTTEYSHRVKMFKATYLGYIESGTDRRVKISRNEVKFVQYWKDPDFSQAEIRREVVTITSTLQLNRIAPIKLDAPTDNA